MERYDVIVVGAGLAGLVAATEAVERGFSVCLVDQEGSRTWRAGLLVAGWSFC